jgi:hypothetical protein
MDGAAHTEPPCVFCEIAAGRERASVYVLPRITGDGFRLRVSWISPDRAELDATAALLRASLAARSG